MKHKPWLTKHKKLVERTAEAEDTCVRRLDLLREAFEKIDSLTTQLHRVARERDNALEQLRNEEE